LRDHLAHFVSIDLDHTALTFVVGFTSHLCRQHGS
jgi:hypothetical protein